MGTIIRNGIIYGTSVPMDTELSPTSENPVQNKVINTALNLKADKTELPTIDSSLSTESENPVQNKVITTPLNAVTNKVQGISSTTNDSIVMGNNVTVYYTNTAPTGDIAEGSIGIGF